MIIRQAVIFNISIKAMRLSINILQKQRNDMVKINHSAAIR